LSCSTSRAASFHRLQFSGRRSVWERRAGVMLAPRNVANCYVAPFKRGGRSIAAARASTNQYAAVRADVSLYILIRAYVSWRHTSSVLVDLRTQSAGCECRGMLGNARGPQLGGARGERARSKSDTDGLAIFFGKAQSDWHRSASRRATRAARITRRVHTRRVAARNQRGSVPGVPNQRAVFSVCVSSGSRQG